MIFQFLTWTIYFSLFSMHTCISLFFSIPRSCDGSYACHVTADSCITSTYQVTHLADWAPSPDASLLSLPLLFLDTLFSWVTKHQQTLDMWFPCLECIKRCVCYPKSPSWPFVVLELSVWAPLVMIYPIEHFCFSWFCAACTLTFFF
jgi:hypothetical protein